MSHSLRSHRRPTSTRTSRRTSTSRLLRFITCGSVDDGKSTLIGRLLYESHLVFEDHLAALEADSAKVGTQGSRPRLRAAARRSDGRARAGHHDRRRLPVLLDRAAQVHRRRHARARAVHPQHGDRRLDRRRRRDPGRRPQGRAHPDPPPQLPRVAARHQARRRRDQQDGPRRLLASSVFEAIEAEYREFAAQIGLDEMTFIPLSALKGDNVTEPSDNTHWYHGPDPDRDTSRPCRSTTSAPSSRSACPVQWVNRPEPRLPWVLRARSSAAPIRPGDAVRVLPAGTTSTVDRIVTMDGDLDEAIAGQSVTLTLTDEIDASRGRPDLRRRRAGRGRRPVRGATSSGCTRMRCCPAARTS